MECPKTQLIIVIALLFHVSLVLSQRIIFPDDDYLDYIQPRRPIYPPFHHKHHHTHGSNNNFPRPTPRVTTVTTTPPSTTTARSHQLSFCLQHCPVTSQYDPVCANDNKTYDNRNILLCFQRCGVNIQILRLGRCAPRGPST